VAHDRRWQRPCPDWATPYEAVANGELRAETAEPHARSGDDLVLLYTAHQGLPKGVMWRQDDLFICLNTERGDIYPDLPDLQFVRSESR